MEAGSNLVSTVRPAANGPVRTAPEVVVPAVPRIQRAVPDGPVTRAGEPIPVIVTIRWHNGPPTECAALAVAWTRAAVEVRWTDPWGQEQTDWVEAADVRRPGAPPAPAAGPQMPTSRGRRKNNRW